MAKTKNGGKRPKGRFSSPHLGAHGHQGFSHPLVVVSQRRRGQKPRIKRVSWRDEEIVGMSVSDMQEFQDPAILVVREIPKIRYNRDELMKLREAPLSNKKPHVFEGPHALTSIYDYKRVKDSNDHAPKNDTSSDHRVIEGLMKKRPGDPRERIRKENDGIVLSPQRRSFNSGCFVPSRETRPNRPHSPLGGAKPEPPNHLSGPVREIHPRRVGSGRILRDWDFNDKSEAGDAEYSNMYRNNSSGNSTSDSRPNTNSNNDRDERRNAGGFTRVFNYPRDKEPANGGPTSGGGGGGSRRNNGRYSDRRRINDRVEDEPEWYSGGPKSQNDTIELHGFEDHEKAGKKKMSPSRVKRFKEWVKKKNNESQAVAEENDEESDGKKEDRSSPSLQEAETNSGQKQAKEEGTGEKGDQYYEDILKCDSIPGLLPNGDGGEGENSKSRFSRWFSQRSPEKPASRRTSLQDEHQQQHHHIVKNILNDLGEPTVAIPGESELFFAPISPAANTGGIIGKNGQSIDIMEMLQRGKTQQRPPQSQMPGKMLSLDELEAKMRQTSVDLSTIHPTSKPQAHQHREPPKAADEEKAAFNKMLAQANIGHGGNGSQKSQPMSIMEMLKHSQQQDEARANQILGGGGAGGGNSPNLNNIHLANELNIKLAAAQQQHQQQKFDLLSKLMPNAMHAGMPRASPVHDMGLTAQNLELLNRPEAQAILQAMHQRIPSPRELQVHTQNILQRALIKKKLEEQQENFRKKQEMQRGQSPNTNQGTAKNVSSPTQFAFTPTSVLRNMTVSKDEGKENKSLGDLKMPQGRAVTGMKAVSNQNALQQAPPQQQQNNQVPWNQQQQYSIKQLSGRPIVKANSNYQPASSTDNYIFQQQQQQQQQRLYNQMSQNSNAGQGQRNKASNPGGMPPQSNPSQFANGPSGVLSHHSINQFPSNQFNQQLTQQQLRAQHQQHARPVNQPPAQQQQPPQGMGAGFSSGNQQNQPGQQQQPLGNAWQQLFQNNRHMSVGRGGGLNDGDLSPTTNQLARWFTPDLLERARVGELPSTAGLAQHAVSLEEIERQAAPPVHN